MIKFRLALEFFCLWYAVGWVNFFSNIKKYSNGDNLSEPELTWLTRDLG
jgi:hypothetical protein